MVWRTTLWKFQLWFGVNYHLFPIGKFSFFRESSFFQNFFFWLGICEAFQAYQIMWFWKSSFVIVDWINVHVWILYWELHLALLFYNDSIDVTEKLLPTDEEEVFLDVGSLGHAAMVFVNKKFTGAFHANSLVASTINFLIHKMIFPSLLWLFFGLIFKILLAFL